MDDESESLHRYGTPLEPLDEDEVLTKKPIQIEDQIVTDENGKRRFHGAFTGGFSAGFWNTVGSLEGWKPTNFKSSRSEKAPQRATQRPEDFMDDEDLGEFGIAPQRIEVKTDYQLDNRKRKFLQPALVSGPIPGEPALAALLQPVMKDKIAVQILKSMGWKPGQGIGPRLTAKEKKRARVRNKREEYILRKYADDDDGKKQQQESEKAASDGATEEDESQVDDDDGDDEITFAPDDYEPLVCSVKTDRFGLGYTSLRENEASGGSAGTSTKKLQRFQLFEPLEMLDRDNKKLSISGQAFGVGALEEEDDDIYARDDLSKYDFSLEERKKQTGRKVQKPVQEKHVVEGYSAAVDAIQFQRPFLVELPSDFRPRNWALRRSRFAPLATERALEIEESSAYRKRGLGRHDLNPDKRGALLEEKPKETQVQVQVLPQLSLDELQSKQRARNERTKALLDLISSKGDNFTRGGLINAQGEEEVSKQNEEMKKHVVEEQQTLLAKAGQKTKDLASTVPAGGFKPFLGNEAKQQRYEKFLSANLRDETEITEFLASIQPVELSAWDREMEKKEFIQARKIYKPLGGIMSDRFVSEAILVAENNASKKEATTSKGDSQEPSKIIKMERSKEMWKPNALLCKRYNIAEPFGGSMEDTSAKPAKKTKLSIFNYLETSVNTKANFQTPVIIPKHIEKPKALVNNRDAVKPPSSEDRAAKQMENENSSATNSASDELKPQAGQQQQQQRHFKPPTKTELEKRVEESRDKPASEKVELFRSIFEDSDDEVDLPSATTKAPTALELEKLQLPTMPLTTLPANAAAANLLRNTSPPRGIFAALFNTKNQMLQTTTNTTNEVAEKSEKAAKVKVDPISTQKETTTTTKITFKSRAARAQEQAEANANTADAYGPNLPKKSKLAADNNDLGGATTSNAAALDARLLSSSLLSSKKPSADVWIERKADESKSSNSGSSDDSCDSSSSSSTQSKRRKKLKRAKKSLNKDKSKKSKKSAKKKSKSKKKHHDSEHKKMKAMKQKKKKHK